MSCIYGIHDDIESAIRQAEGVAIASNRPVNVCMGSDRRYPRYYVTLDRLYRVVRSISPSDVRGFSWVLETAV